MVSLIAMQRVETTPLPVHYPGLADRVLQLRQRLLRHAKKLTALAICFRCQLQVQPEQCSEAVKVLSVLRKDVEHVTFYLARLSPAEARILKPNATIGMLAELDYRLRESMVAISEFEKICQTNDPSRSGVHLYIHSALRRTLAGFDAATSQLAALPAIERVECGRIVEGARI
jgi:hypothetical protein